MIAIGVTYAEIKQEKEQSMLAHRLLREMLRRYDIPLPHGTELAKEKGGRPFFLSNGAPLPSIDFNLSHTRRNQGDRGSPGLAAAACILSYQRTSGLPCPRVGIDIEFPRTVLPYERLAERYFSQKEQAYLNASRDPCAAFLTVWTRKEAFLKYCGTGISRNLQEFDLLPPAKKEAVRLYTVPLPGITPGTVSGIAPDSILSFCVPDSVPRQDVNPLSVVVLSL